MKASALLDRPIVFHRVFVELTGSIQAALMLSQALYWQRRQTEDGDGWWFQTATKWEAETGMTRREQEGARKALRQTTFWSEDLRGAPAKMHFRVDENLLLEALGLRETSLAESAKLDCTKAPNWIGGKRQTTVREENQEETKKENAPKGQVVRTTGMVANGAHAFIVAWCEAHERVFGAKYHVDGPDAGAANAIAKHPESIEELINLAVWCWVEAPKDRRLFQASRGTTIRGFNSALNGIKAEWRLKTNGRVIAESSPGGVLNLNGEVIQ